MPNSTSGQYPIPTPRIIRPSVNRSSVTARRATSQGRCRGRAATIGPMCTLLVACPMAPSNTHGSATGMPSSTTMWSQTKNPSQPASSAATARSTSNPGSAYSPKFGKLRPNRTLPRLSSRRSGLDPGQLSRGIRDHVRGSQSAAPTVPIPRRIARPSLSSSDTPPSSSPRWGAEQFGPGT